MHKTDPQVRTTIVLLGAGNTNLQIAHWWGMNPIPGAMLVLVSDAAVIPYSGMLPGFFSGCYTRDEITIDLRRLCAVGGVQLVLATAEHIDLPNRQIVLRGRTPIHYDVLCLNLGSQPQRPDSGIPGSRAIVLKPFHTAMDNLAALDCRVAESQGRLRFAFVGGGAGAFEICLALKARYGDRGDMSFHIIGSADRICGHGPRAVSLCCERILHEKGIAFTPGVCVSGADDAMLYADSGERIPYDICTWLTSAGPLDLVAQSGFDTDDRGFIRVQDNLQTVSDAAVFATGDCSTLKSYPRLPKAGIFSVRQGPVLWNNLAATVAGDELEDYQPQKLYLFLLNTSDGNAVISYGNMARHGRWAFSWKDFIDRRWMRKFHDAYRNATMPDSAHEEMRCGGCGAKLGRDVLNRVLDRLAIPASPNVIIGARPGDDAAVHRPPAGKVEVQSVDFFREFVDDPYLFGRVAAINALSDLYAMNADPFSALATVTIPYAGSAVREEQLYQVLSGALESFAGHDITLAGGHSSESEEFQIGFTITGYADEDALFRKDALRVGDRLILTKLLGTGALLRAWAMGQCESAWAEELVAGMLASNRDAMRVFSAPGVRACTDVTGFGLAGHLLEMLDVSGVSARLDIDAVRTYPGFGVVTSMSIVSTLHEENAKAAERIEGADGVQPAWLYDPQTSGGLLAGVPPDRVDDTLLNLRNAGYPYAVCIGEVVAMDDDTSIISLE